MEGPRWGPPPRRQTNVILWIGGQTPFADAVRACRVGNRLRASAACIVAFCHIACLCD